MSPHLDSTDRPSQPVCDEVCGLLSAIVDGRATLAETAFANAHLSRCPTCASQMAFLRAAKTAWAKQPVVMPPSDLSARIAAATYRKPTFAQQFTAFFAFLSPAPVRLLVGAAAVAGIAYITLPRMNMTTTAPTAGVTSEQSAPAVAQTAPTVVTDSDKTATTPATVVPPTEKSVAVVKPQPQKKMSVAAPAPAVHKAPVDTQIAATAIPPKPAVITAPKPAPVAPTQIASAAPRAPKPARHEPVISHNASSLPEVGEGGGNTTVVAHQPTVPVEKPEMKEPPQVKAAPVVAAAAAPEERENAYADDPKPMSTRVYMRLGDIMKNANTRSSEKMGGSASLIATAVTQYDGIVKAPVQ